MELSSPNTKKNSYIFSKVSCSYPNIKKTLHFQKRNPALSILNLKKIPYISSNWNFLTQILEKSYIFSKESCSYISESGTLHFQPKP